MRWLLALLTVVLAVVVHRLRPQLWMLRWTAEDWRMWRTMSVHQRTTVRAFKVRPSVVFGRGTYANAQDSIEGHWKSVVQPQVRQVVTQRTLEANRRAIDEELEVNARWQAEIADARWRREHGGRYPSA